MLKLHTAAPCLEEADALAIPSIIDQIGQIAKAGDYGSADASARVAAVHLKLEMASDIGSTAIAQLDLGNPQRKLLHEGKVYHDDHQGSVTSAWLLLLDSHCEL